MKRSHRTEILFFAEHYTVQVMNGAQVKNITLDHQATEASLLILDGLILTAPLLLCSCWKN